jgi:aryl-alcohol dehydrogenase-like predicted oxidoreductase
MEFSKIGLGTFPFSNVFGPVSESEIADIVYEYLDLGGQYIQTAPYYTGVDPILKKILAKISRKKYCLATLCVKDRKGVKSGKYSAIIEQCNDSLSQLGIDYIDLLMTSSAKGSDVPFAETIDAMVDLRKQGKIRSIGVCNVNLEQLKEYNSNGVVSYVQNRFSLIDQSLSVMFINYCEKENIKLIPYNVIEWGILTNKAIIGIALREGDSRKKLSSVFNDEQLSLVQDWVVSQLKPIAEKYNTSIESLAIFWVNNQKLVSTSVVGATKKEQLRSSMRALALEKSPVILAALDKAYVVLADTIRSKHGKGVNEFLKNSYTLWGT